MFYKYKKFGQFAKLRRYPKVKKRMEEGDEHISEEEEKQFLQKAVELPMRKEEMLKIAERLIFIVEELLDL